MKKYTLLCIIAAILSTGCSASDYNLYAALSDRSADGNSQTIQSSQSSSESKDTEVNACIANLLENDELLPEGVKDFWWEKIQGRSDPQEYDLVNEFLSEYLKVGGFNVSAPEEITLVYGEDTVVLNLESLMDSYEFMTDQWGLDDGLGSSIESDVHAYAALYSETDLCVTLSRICGSSPVLMDGMSVDNTISDFIRAWGVPDEVGNSTLKWVTYSEDYNTVRTLYIHYQDGFGVTSLGGSVYGNNW